MAEKAQNLRPAAVAVASQRRRLTREADRSRPRDDSALVAREAFAGLMADLDKPAARARPEPARGRR